MTLIARSWLSLQRMISLLRAALLQRGLKLHPSKCKVQTNSNDCHVRGQVQVDEDFSVEILDEGAALNFLGTELDLHDSTAVAVQNRIDAGWRCFWSMKQLLLNRNVSANQRLKLFDATVGSVVLYCSQSWTPRVEEFRKLEVTRRSMLRRIVGTGRAPDEPWLEWIKRVTTKAVGMASAQKVRQWQEAHLTNKWHWAGHVARRPATSWVWRVTVWRDSEWLDMVEECGMKKPLRPSRRRWMKLDEPVRRFCHLRGLRDWKREAYGRDAWKNLAVDYQELHIILGSSKPQT